MKTRLIALVLLVALLLSGCACQHEWADADCTSPQICTKCQETTGEALGHSWTEATCETPQTCSRCGVTQGQALGHQWDAPDCITPATCRICGLTDGEPLGHDYDAWAQADSDMTHTCLICGNVETIAYDPLLYTQDQLLGNWELVAIGGGSSAEYGPVYAFHFSKNFQVSGRYYNKDFVGTWSLAYITDDYYEGTLTISGEIYNFSYAVSDQVVSTPFCNNDGEYLADALLKRVDDAEPIVIGAWSVEYNDTTYQLKLMSDRTFLASFDAPFHGKWYLYPTTAVQGHSVNAVYLLCATGYERKAFTFFLKRPFEEDSGSIQFYSYFNDDDYKTIFTQTSTDGVATAEEAETLRALQEKAEQAMQAEEAEQAEQSENAPAQTKSLDDFTDVLVGQWISTDFYSLSERDALTPSADGPIDITGILKKSPDYSIQMESDGSFTGILGNSVAGTWTLDPDTLYGDDTFSAIDGTFLLSDSQETYPFSVIYSDGYGYSLRFQWNDHSIIFSYFTPEDYTKLSNGKQQFTGTWDKCSSGVFVDSSATLSETEGCSLTLHDDGTLTGQLLDGAVSGTWSYCIYDPNGGYYTALLEINGQTEEATLYETDAALFFDLLNAEGQRVAYWFTK